MEDIFHILNQIKRLEAAQIFIKVMNNDIVKAKTVKLNTDQMREKYVNADGIRLSDIGGEYSPYTMSKGRKSAPGNVDLYDTGEFHKSFRVENITSTGFDIVSDSIKDDGTDLKIEWGEEIEGLTEESQEELALFILDFFYDEILTSIAA